ncbi:hypothetical protein [Hallella absiana]|uniref:hypothetical protein n=1 Tax=Hallella absiana TaxID=2925336 RepID=UPI0021C97C36|nr:hypothetical protein [Hallella absiana]
MEGIFRDEIEVRQIDKFFCAEMGRQIHRYIKAMHGSLAMMEKFELRLHQLDIPGREEAIARYIDLNRKVVASLDWRMLLARSIANYCDSYPYFFSMLSDESTLKFYIKRMKEKYIRYHQIFEKDGKFGIKDHEGNILLNALYDFLRTPYVYVDDMTAMPIIAEKNGKMGLVLPDGNDTIVVPFEYDDISLRDSEPWFELTKSGQTTLWPKNDHR